MTFQTEITTATRRNRPPRIKQLSSLEGFFPSHDTTDQHSIPQETDDQRQTATDEFFSQATRDHHFSSRCNHIILQRKQRNVKSDDRIEGELDRFRRREILLMAENEMMNYSMTNTRSFDSIGSFESTD